MLIRFDLKNIFSKLGVDFSDYEKYKKMTKKDKDSKILELWNKVDPKKKLVLNEIIQKHLVINNDYFGTIPLNVLYTTYSNVLTKNKITINDLLNMNYEDFKKIKQKKGEKINVFFDFRYKEINPSKKYIEKTLFDFVSSVILGYNLNSVNTYKIVNISLYQETSNDFLVYDFKSVFTNIREYIIILYFILDGIKFDTEILEKILLKTNNKKQNENIKTLIKMKEVTFSEFIKQIGINKEIILSQEIGTLIYNIDLINNISFEKEKTNIMKKLGIKTNEDLFKLLYLYLYFNFK